MTSERHRALKLIEREDRLNEQRAEREREQAEESRIQQAIERVRKDDAERERERARREAKARADELAAPRAELERRADDALDSLLSILAELRLLDEEQRTHLRAAGEDYVSDGHTKRPRFESLDATLKTWVRGKLRELAVTNERELLSVRMSGFPEARPLHEIDPLAQTNTKEG